MGRPAPVPRDTLPLAVSAAWGPLSRSQGGRHRLISTDRRFRGDRFSCSMPAPTTSSRHLYTGRHQGHTQAAPRLRTSGGAARLCPGDQVHSPVSTSSEFVSMRQQWFTHVRLLVAHLTRSCRAFSETLTTTALDRRSFRWFGLSACTASPEGRPPSLAQHGSCWWLLRHHHSPFRTHDLHKRQLHRVLAGQELRLKQDGCCAHGTAPGRGNGLLPGLLSG